MRSNQQNSGSILTYATNFQLNIYVDNDMMGWKSCVIKYHEIWKKGNFFIVKIVIIMSKDEKVQN